MNAVQAVAEAWASCDGRLEAFRACSENPAREASEGRCAGYLVDAEALIARLYERGFVVMPVHA
jgi:hypothetical protein